MPDSIVETDQVDGRTVGKIEGGSFGVTADGAATYELPLWVPAGRCGVQPSLSLRYSSRGGSGTVGVGWSLAGLSQITRGRQTIYDDGADAPVRFTDSDPFYLDGERLVLVSGAHARDGAQYRTKHDSFTRVDLHRQGSGPLLFEVFYKDGRIANFGGNTATFTGRVQSFVAVPGAIPDDASALDGFTTVSTPVEYGWGLATMADRSGNSYSVEYDVGIPGSAPDRHFLPSSITYADRTIELVWETRPDVDSRYVSGLSIPADVRLALVRVHGPNPTTAASTAIAVLRTYRMTYRNDSVSGRSLLSTVTELDQFNVAKGDHVFDWELGQSVLEARKPEKPIWDIKSTPVGLSTLPGRIRIYDFNGDGRDDLFYVPISDPNYFYILLSDPSTPTGFSAPIPTGIKVPRAQTTNPPLLNDRVYIFPDPVDGRATNILLLDNSSFEGPDVGTYRVYVIRPNATGSVQIELASQQPFPPASPNTETVVQGSIEVMDLDGDGLPDLLHGYVPSGGGVSWYMRAGLPASQTSGVSPGPPFEAVEEWLGLPGFSQNHLSLNLDGGSATQLLVDNLDADDARFTALSIRRAPASKLTISRSIIRLLRDRDYVFGNFTGSGLPSAFSLGRANNNGANSPYGPSITENHGGFFGFSQYAEINLPAPPSPYVPALRVMDWFQDGRSHIVARAGTDKNGSTANAPVDVLRWNGTGFDQTQICSQTWTPFSSQNDSSTQSPTFNIFEVFDYDGNGLDDLLYLDGVSNASPPLTVQIRQGNRADMMTGVTDGLGAKIKITYAPISDPTVYTPDDFGNAYFFPQTPVNGKMWVVRQYTAENGNGGVNTFQYSYTAGVQDRWSGFLGFQSRRVRHVETGIVTDTTYDPRFLRARGIYPLRGLPITQTTTTPLLGGIEQQVSVVTTYVCGSGDWNASPPPIPLFAYPSQIITTLTETQNGVATMDPRVCTTSQIADEYGNITFRGDQWSDGNASNLYVTFDNNAASWLIAQPITRTEQSVVGTQAASHLTAYQYDALGRLAAQVIEPGTLGAGGYEPLPPQTDGAQSLFRIYQRNADGNVASVSDQRSMVASADSRKTSFSYDSTNQIYPIRIMQPYGNVLESEVHPGLGVISHLTDANGVQSWLQYDGFGRLRHVQSPDGNHQTVHYLPSSNPALAWSIEQSLASGPAASVDYDLLGRARYQTIWNRDDGKAVLRESKYDDLGRLAAQSLPYFEGDTAAYDVAYYDVANRVTYTAGADGTSRTYNYLGVWSWITDGNGNVRARRVDDRNRTVFITDRDAALVGQTPGPQGMTYDYLPFDAVGKVTDIFGNTSSRTTDRFGRALTLTDPQVGNRQYAYNAFGELAQETKGDNQVVTYAADLLGRVVLVSDPVDGDVQYSWDSAANGIGKPGSIIAPQSGVSIQFTYDALSRLHKKSWRLQSGDNHSEYTITRNFDDLGRLQSIDYPQVAGWAQFSATYNYGNYGQLLTVTSSDAARPYWSWVSGDASGLFGSVRYGNDLTDTRIEDSIRPGALQAITTHNQSGTIFRNTEYYYEANMNLYRRLDHIAATDETFQYGPLDRLIRWTWNGTGGTRQVRWDYDDIGNIVQRQTEVGPTDRDLVYTYGVGAQHGYRVTATNLGSYNYDLKGNQVAAPGRQVWFGRGDLPTRVEQTSNDQTQALALTYDGENSRVRSVDEQSGITSDTIGGLYEFRRPNGSADYDGEHAFSVVVGGRAVARRIWTIAEHQRTHDVEQFLHVDHQGSIDLVTSGHGAVLERLKYEPYGRRVDVNDPAQDVGARQTTLETGYTNQEQLDAWQLIDMRGRFYDPTIGKFLSADPFIPNPVNPQSWNRYGYVLSNPMTLTDPSGFDDVQPGITSYTYDDETVVVKRPQPVGEPSKGRTDAAQQTQGSSGASSTKNDDGHGGTTSTGADPVLYTDKENAENAVAVAKVNTSTPTIARNSSTSSTQRDQVTGVYGFVGAEAEREFESSKLPNIGGEAIGLVGYDKDNGWYGGGLAGGGAMSESLGLGAMGATEYIRYFRTGDSAKEYLALLDGGLKLSSAWSIGLGVFTSLRDPHNVGIFLYGAFYHVVFGSGITLRVAVDDESRLRQIISSKGGALRAVSSEEYNARSAFKFAANHSIDRYIWDKIMNSLGF